MRDSTLSNSGHIHPRQAVKLPSIWAHLFWAFALLIILSASAWIYSEAFGLSDARVPHRYVAIDSQPQPPESDTLAGQSQALPDLLDGDVPMNVNPTTLLGGGALGLDVDALGNPVGDARNTQSAPDTSRTIRINGQPISTTASLPPAPIPGLTRQSNFGPIPAPNAQGLTPASAYKKPAGTNVSGTPVSIVIGGLGINRTVTQQAISNLPADVTLSFAAHAPNLQNWIDQARRAGHEVLLELPMESYSFDATEPGSEFALKSDSSQSDNLQNLDRMLSRGQGYFGITNFNGDKFLARSDAVAPVIDHLSKAGLGFVFDGAFSAPSLPVMAASSKLPFSQAYTLLDLVPDSTNIDLELSRLQAKASAGGGAVAFGFAYPQTIDSVSRWAANLSGSGLVLVPASTTLKAR